MNEKKNTAKRRSALRIMGSLIGLVKPLLHIMMAAIILGTMGYLCAIFLTILAGQVIVHGLLTGAAGTSLSVQNMWLVHTPVKTILTVMIVIAVLRGILHYAEQYCNHFIAFKLLAIIRHKVFAALRKLCPAKLEGRDKGNLISIITTDIELLEVFYAHTISPIAIAALTSLIMVCFIGRYHVLAGLLALAAYLTVGVVIPMWNGKRGSQKVEAERDRKKIRLEGEVPSPINTKPGCKFQGRCKYAKDICRQQMPELKDVGNNHFVACHFCDALEENKEL